MFGTELFKEAGADTDTATTMALDMLFAGQSSFVSGAKHATGTS